MKNCKLLIKYKIDPILIHLITKVYTEDETVINVGGREETIKIGSGIKGILYWK